MSNLRRKLELRISTEQGPVLDLDDWYHLDYIEDVLAEHFDIEYEYLIADEKSGKNTLYFCDSTDIDVLQNAISAINKHHEESSELYDVI